MPRSEVIPSAALLHEMGGSEVRTTGGDEREGELLRLASDPLLLHAYMNRNAIPKEGTLTLRRDPTVLVLGMRAFIAERPADRRGRFDAMTASVAPSLWPEVFVPSDTDRDLSPDGSGEDVVQDSRWPAMVVPAFLFLVLCVGLLLVLI